MQGAVLGRCRPLCQLCLGICAGWLLLASPAQDLVHAPQLLLLKHALSKAVYASGLGISLGLLEATGWPELVGACLQVISGLVKFIPEAEMQNRLCVVVANLKPANMKGIKSHAMVLAASSADGEKVGLQAAWLPSTSVLLLPACIHPQVIYCCHPVGSFRAPLPPAALQKRWQAKRALSWLYFRLLLLF